jgi:hypothetical protein
MKQKIANIEKRFLLIINITLSGNIRATEQTPNRILETFDLFTLFYRGRIFKRHTDFDSIGSFTL